MLAANTKAAVFKTGEGVIQDGAMSSKSLSPTAERKQLRLTAHGGLSVDQRFKVKTKVEGSCRKSVTVTLNCEQCIGGEI